MTRAISSQARTIRLPVHVVEQLNKIKQTQQRLSQELGWTPSLERVAQELEMSPAQLRQLVHWAIPPMSLDLAVGSQQDTAITELLAAEGKTPEEYAMYSELSDNLESLLSKLTPRQREVIIWRFGLEDGNQLSLETIGRRLKCSRERVRQIENAALNRVRHERERR